MYMSLTPWDVWTLITFRVWTVNKSLLARNSYVVKLSAVDVPDALFKVLRVMFVMWHFQCQRVIGIDGSDTSDLSLELLVLRQ